MLELLGILFLIWALPIYIISLPFIMADKASKGMLDDLSLNPTDYME